MDSVKDYFLVVYFFVCFVFYRFDWFQTTLPSIKTLSEVRSAFFGFSLTCLLFEISFLTQLEDDSSDSSTTFLNFPLVFLGTATSEEDLSFSDFFSEEYSLDSYLIDDFFSDSDSSYYSDYLIDSDLNDF